MRRSILRILTLSVALAGPGRVSAQPSAGDASADPTLRPFLNQVEAATTGFINGDVSLWNQIVSRRDDATILGAWGSHAKGWKETGARYAWAASRMAEGGGKVKVEYIASAVSGDLAYTVAIERSEARLAGQDKPAPMALRVTHIFRREDDGWKLVHRHADPLIEKTEPGTVLRK